MRFRLKPLLRWMLVCVHCLAKRKCFPMRWSQYFIPTLREDPADAEVVSHKLLLRAGIVRQLSAGIYSYLPLGQRIAVRIMQILREEMNRIGGQEFYLPALHPAELWQESGRWSAIDDIMFRLKDRKGAEMCLGLMRLRTFIMKDAYTFDVDREGLDRSFADQREAYKKIFTRCGIQFSIVEASSGAMGGSESSEFVAKTDAGEDLIASCANCGYAANVEKATSRLPVIEDDAGPEKPEQFPTPGVRTIEDLTTFPGGAAADRQIKSLVFMATIDGEARPVLALLRGDHQLHEVKFTDVIGATGSRPAQPEEIRELLGASAGSLGGIGAKKAVPGLFIIADLGLKGRRNMTTGANKDDHHLRGVNIERDIEVDQWADLRTVTSGEACPRCDSGTLEVYKAMEVGHIFKLGTTYSESMGATVLTEEGKPVPIIMGSYGIGVERIISAAVEQHSDADGIVWAKAIAPFDVVVTVTNMKDEKLREEGEKLYHELQQAGLDVLLDDRNERAGVKFKDADLIGIPHRITIGKKIADGIVELFDRRTKQSEDVKLGEVVARVKS